MLSKVYYTCTCTRAQHVSGKDGIIEAEIVNKVVPKSVLKEILTWREEGCTIEDVVARL